MQYRVKEADGMTNSIDPDQKQSDLSLHSFVTIISHRIGFYGIQHFKHLKKSIL